MEDENDAQEPEDNEPNQEEEQERKGPFPAIWSEEGKYLASVLGDALVQGLTHVSQERPDDPVEYLANFLRGYGSRSQEDLRATTAGTVAQAPEEPAIPEEEPDGPEEPDIPEEPQEPEPTTEETEQVEQPEEENGEDPFIQEQEELPEPEEPNEGEGQDLPAGDGDDDPVSDDAMERLNSQAKDPDDGSDDSDEEAIKEVIDPDAETDKGILTEHTGTRDDRGQSVLHFAAARPGGASTILAFLNNPSVNLAWRDERLRTARDVAEGMQRTENLKTIDSFVVSLIIQGQLETLERLVYDGYDKILNLEDTTQAHVIEIAEKAGQRQISLFLRTLPDFQERLLKLHRAVRHGAVDQAKEIMQSDKKLSGAISPWGRCILHVAVLVEQHSIVQYVAANHPECLRRGDNMERTALHYAMGIEKVEKMTRILVKAGAKRVVKDLRGRQPSYYFINRDEIAQLQKEEEQLKIANA